MPDGRCLWLADQLRDSGLEFAVLPGWEKRGSGTLRPRGVVAHHVGIGGQANASGLRVVTHGRSDLPGPLCNVHQGRDGRPTVVAAGLAKHAGRGGGFGVFQGLAGNGSVLGIEAEGTTGEVMSARQYGGYVALVAALLHGLRRYEGVGEPAAGSHNEWRDEKPDAWGLIHGPGGMNGFRHAVAQRPQTIEEDDDVTDDDRRMIREIHAAMFEGAPQYGVPAIRTAVRDIDYSLAGADLEGKPSIRGVLAQQDEGHRLLRRNVQKIARKLGLSVSDAGVVSEPPG